ncbi:MAG: prefoldin subunit, partial [Nanoarchaeota archaeon]
IDPEKAVYKTIGNIMVRQETQHMQAELDEREKMLQTRLETISAQEKKLQEKKASLQNDILEKMKEGEEQ